MDLNLPVPEKKPTRRGYERSHHAQPKQDRPTTKATTFREAVNVLDPDRHLKTKNELENFFVQRDGSPIDELQVILEMSDDPKKFLFSGHRGSGRSTELSRLGQRLEEDFIVVQFSAKRILNLFDLTHVDVLLSIGLQLFQRAAELGEDLDLNPELLQHVLEFTKTVSKEEMHEEATSADVSAGLKAFVASVISKISVQDVTRHTVREETKSRLQDLLDGIEDIAQELKAKSGRRILMIVEDLDKADLDTASTLFYKHAQELTAPSVSIIYTFPIALRHHEDFMQIRNNFPQVHTLPNVKTETMDGDRYPRGIEILKGILTQRVRDDLFAEDALTLLAEKSSGIPRELVSLARQSVVQAVLEKHDAVQPEDVLDAVRDRRQEYDILLSDAQRRLLGTIRKTKEVDNSDEYRQLLHNLSVLEYANDDVWYDVHPLARDLIVDPEIVGPEAE